MRNILNRALMHWWFETLKIKCYSQTVVDQKIGRLGTVFGRFTGVKGAWARRVLRGPTLKILFLGFLYTGEQDLFFSRIKKIVLSQSLSYDLP